MTEDSVYAGIRVARFCGGEQFHVTIPTRAQRAAAADPRVMAGVLDLVGYSIRAAMRHAPDGGTTWCGTGAADE